MQERLKKSTKCPNCEYELDDDDGSFFNTFSDTKKCPECETSIQFIMQQKRDIGNPYCDYVWHKTYMRWGI